MHEFQKMIFLAWLCAVLIACEEDDIRQTEHYNGIRKTQVAYKNDKPHGEFKRWTSHGDLAESGIYKNGFREGEWTEWFANGKIQARGQYEHGKMQGLWLGYYHDGKIAWERTYKDGEPVGIWTEYYPSGKIQERNSCFKNAQTGVREVFAASGKRERLEHCKYGILNGSVETYYPGGALESSHQYSEGTLHGKAILFRATGKIWRTAFYKFGLRDSLWTYYSQDGSEEKTSLFKNGNGIAYGELGEKGIDAETTLVNNLVQDTIRYTLPGHSLLYEEIWHQGEKLKLTSRYTQNNQIASEGFFSNGKRNGFWRNWYLNGKLKDSLFYKDDEVQGEQLHYDSTGKLYMRKTQFGKNGPMQVKFE